MLREEYIRSAAALHIEGARTLRDSAASLLPCCTLFAATASLKLQRVFTAAEELMRRAVSLSAGLIERSAMTKHTAVIEARMRLLGIEPDASLTHAQTACEKTRDVPPGTRADVFDGFVALGIDAERAAADFLQIVDYISAAMREGRSCFALPLSVLKFLHIVNADYAAACRRLAEGEEAKTLRRDDAYEQFLQTLRYIAYLQGAEAMNASADTLAALAAGGMIAAVPPALYDVLLRYERYE